MNNIFTLIISFLVLLHHGGYCNNYNFTWTDNRVYGQPNFTTNQPNVFNAADDFILTSSNTILATNTDTPSEIIEMDKNGTVIFQKLEPSLDDLLSLLELNNSFLVGTEQVLVEFDKSFNTTQTWPYSFNQLTGLGFNQGLIYASNLQTCRILAFPLNGNYSTPTLTYGDSNCGSTPTASNLHGPRRILFDCNNNGFWVADSLNNRVLHFTINSNVADVVLGQNDFTSSGSTMFQNPAGLAYNYDCSILFVSDSYRVYRFRAPFRTGQTPEGILGSNSSSPPTQSTFDRIPTIHLEDYRNGQVRLYLLDKLNNRIVSGITYYGPLLNTSGFYPLYCTNNSSPSSCVIQGDVSLNDFQILHFNQTLLTVTGNLALSNGSQVLLDPFHNAINVSGNVRFAGTLVLNISSYNLSRNQQAPIFNSSLFEFGSSTGRFVRVLVISENGTEGECGINAHTTYGNYSLRVDLQNGCETYGSDSSLDHRKNMIIGIVVGIGGCGALICGIAIFMVAIAIYDRVTGKREGGANN